MNKALRLLIGVLAALLILCVAGVAAYLRLSDALYGPAHDASKFVSATVARGGQTGVFTFTRRIYRPAAEGLFPFMAAGGSKSVVDRNYIATFDFDTGQVQILHVEDNLLGPWMPGSGNFFVSHSFGDRVIVRQGGQRREDGALEYRDYWLELDSGRLTRLPVIAELGERGYEPAYFYLIDEEGTLVIVSEPAGSSGSAGARRLWVRMPDGTYHDVGPFKHYYGVEDGEVHYWSAEDRYTAYSLESGSRRHPARSEYGGVSTDPKRDMALQVDFAVRYDEGHRLHVGRRVGGSWEYDRLSLTVQDLAPPP